MVNVDGVPVASQMKSLIQAARGNREAARETQVRFSERCIGVAQIRSVVEAAKGHPERAAQTQQRFVSNARRIMQGDAVDAVPGASQLKSIAQAMSGNSESAVETQGNFTRRCPVVSQARSVFEAVALDDPEQAAKTQREFLASAKGGVKMIRSAFHDILGKDDNAEDSVASSNDIEDDSEDGRTVDEEWLQQMLGPQRTVSERPSFLLSSALRPSEMPEEGSMEGSLEHTSAVIVDEAMCESHGACPICLSQFEVGENARLLPCFHMFHDSCAGPWLKMHANCPVCRCVVRSTR
jgi:hypothetical protein